MLVFDSLMVMMGSVCLTIGGVLLFIRGLRLRDELFGDSKPKLFGHLKPKYPDETKPQYTPEMFGEGRTLYSKEMCKTYVLRVLTDDYKWVELKYRYVGVNENDGVCKYIFTGSSIQ